MKFPKLPWNRLSIPLRVKAVEMGLLYGTGLTFALSVGSPAPNVVGGYLYRPPCADIIAHQLASEKGVQGSFQCLGGDVKDLADYYAINSDQKLADAIGVDGTYFFRGETNDGTYVYEVDVHGKSYLVKIYIDNGKVYDWKV